MYKTDGEILYALRKVGMVGIERVITYKSFANPKYHRGFAFVQFLMHDFAFYARTIFTDRLHLFNRIILVDWATILPQIDDDDLSLVSALNFDCCATFTNISLCFRLIRYF